eukprot:6424584-Prymnesium_polylepis.1
MPALSRSPATSSQRWKELQATVSGDLLLFFLRGPREYSAFLAPSPTISAPLLFTPHLPLHLPFSPPIRTYSVFPHRFPPAPQSCPPHAGSPHTAQSRNPPPHWSEY